MGKGSYDFCLAPLFYCRHPTLVDVALLYGGDFLRAPRV